MPLAVEAPLGLALGLLAIAIFGIGLAGVFALPLLLGVVLGGVAIRTWHRARGFVPARRGSSRSRTATSRAARTAKIGAAVVVAVAAVSWASALSRPSNSSVGIRTVEWLRDNGGRGFVSEVERLYYSMTAPSKGGPALRQLPLAGVAGGPAAPPHLRTVHRVAGYRPPPLRLAIHPRLPGEGSWRVTQRRFANDPSPPVLVTRYRPDPSYPRVVAGLAWINPKRVSVSLHPGLQEPPGGGPRGSSEVPQSARRGLLATFNSGFKHTDGAGGFFARGRLFEPLVPGLGTVIGTANGRLDVRAWHGGARPPAGVVFARQNLPLIVDHGRPNPALSTGPQWGATLGNAILVWRSGLGVDRHGDLIYAAAPDQTVSGIAHMLIHAGAVRAIELDINSYWVTLNTYGKSGARDPRQLLQAMNRPAARYLSPDDRDFFAVSLR